MTLKELCAVVTVKNIKSIPVNVLLLMPEEVLLLVLSYLTPRELIDFENNSPDFTFDTSGKSFDLIYRDTI